LQHALQHAATSENPILSLVMMPLCSAFTAADKTDALAAGNIAKMSLQQWVGTELPKEKKTAHA